MKRILAIALCLIMALAIVACGTPAEQTTEAPKNDTTEAPETPATEAEYKLGMGIVVKTDSSKTGLAQVDATVATVVTDANGKIVACRIDVAQNKYDLTKDFATEAAKTFETKMELGDRYNMAGKVDNDNDGVKLEWDAQAKAFEKHVVGMTVDQVAAMRTQLAGGHYITTDADLLNAGCSMQITDFIQAVVKACDDRNAVAFKANPKKMTLGVAAITTVDGATKAATAEADGSVNMYTDFACAVVVKGKVVATLNDAIQPKFAINANGEIVSATFAGTKRELRYAYNMEKFGSDNDGDERVLEWYLQSAAFSSYVMSNKMTADKIDNMETTLVNNHYISTDSELISAGCTMQITGICDVVAKAARNAR